MTMGRDLEAMHQERLRDELRKDRAKNFRVEIDKPRYGGSDELTVKWTYNGHQWQSADFTAHERLIMIKALLQGLT